MDAFIYPHHAGHFFNEDVNTKILATLGEQIFIDTVHEIFVNYPKKLNDKEISMQRSKFGVTCDPDLDVGFDNCLINALDKRALKSIGCTFPTLTNLKSQSCDAKLINETQAKLLHDYKLFKSQAELLDCALPCSTMNVALGFPKYDKEYSPFKARAKVYFKRSVTEKRNIVPYDWVSLMAEIGGYVGLLLGWSLMDLRTIFNAMVQGSKL